MGNVCVQCGKIEAVKVFGSLGFVDFFRTSVALYINYPKTVDACIPGDSFTLLFGN